VIQNKGQTVINFDRIREAAAGKHGEDQRQLVTAGLQIVDTLLKKNTDYGGSAWQTPILAPTLSARQAIQCRMSDKVMRLARLLSGETALVQESIEDTMRDLAGYSVLWIAAPEESSGL
jgi:hypothetical protein